MMRQLGGSFGIAIITTFITLQSGASCKFSCSFGTKFEVQRLQLFTKVYVKGLLQRSNEKHIKQLIIRHETKYRVILYGYFLYLEFYFCAVFQLYS
jgi:hypothetical protein